MLIDLRNAMMTGKRLPYDAEVEFLESTGMQYIDTDIVAADDVGYELRLVDWQSRWPSTTNFVFAGVFGSSNRFGLGYSGSINPRYNAFAWWNTPLPELGTLIAISNGYIRFNFLNSRSYDYNGVISGSLSGTYNASNTTIRLLNAKRMDTGENIFSDSVPAKISAFKISKGDIIVRDYIPVRKGTVGYLYDRVSGRLFGNEGTGDFVLGPDKN